MHTDLAGAVARGIVGLDDLGPEPACGAELGHLQEVVRRDTEIELDLLRHLLCGQTGLAQFGDQIVTPSHRIA